MEKTCPSTDEWIKKMWYIYIIEYYSAIKKNKIMSFAATWMEKNLILSEVSQNEKDKYGHYLMVKGSIKEEDITIINTYAPNTGSPR